MLDPAQPISTSVQPVLRGPALVRPVHTAVPGRARLEVTGLRRSERVRGIIESGLAGEPGITSVWANPVTGRVLVLFTAEVALTKVIAALGALLASSEGRSKFRTPGVPAPARPARGAAHLTLVSSQTVREPRPWHLLGADDAVAALQSSKAHGLAYQAARERLQRYGPNVLSRARPRSGLSIFLGQFNSLPVMLLAGSAVISVLTGGLADAAVIMGVVLINAGIGYVTESQAERTINALGEMARPPAAVLRGGAITPVDAEEVVPGDIVLLVPGTRIAADGRLLDAGNLTVDESALTGESLPVTKSVERITLEGVALADRSNMIYMGTAVTGGSGLAVVVATGRETEIGRIQTLVGETRPPETPMQRQLDEMGNQTVWLSLAICGLVFGVGLLRGYGLLQMLKASISLAVAAVPEGLPTVATTTLALGIRDMRRHKVLIRQLAAVETLGSVQVICLDKTGTLTMNRMSVLAAHTGMERMTVAGGAFWGGKGRVDPLRRDELLRLLHVAVLCNEAELKGGPPAYAANGSATELALLQMALASGVDVNGLRARHPLARVEYRAENRNYMTTLHEAPDGGQILAVKGSPGEVLALCRWHVRDGARYPLADADRLAIANENECMAGEALRVLGFAYGPGRPRDAVKEQGLVWLGLVGMADPVRQGVQQLIGRFHRAGIKTVMITGDQSATAYAIGRQLALSGDGVLEILDSSHLEKIDPEVMSALAQKVHIFSRVSPVNKLQIVQGLQWAGKVVAMTGDGINDGPALKAADIGVAMGGAGTDVARSVADVVLEDDDLQTMIVAVSQGRTIYDNIRKSVHFLMSTNLSEIMVMLASIGAGLGQPLNTMQLLWLNLITDIFPALALAVEPPEPDVLRRPPRDPRESIIRPSDFKRYGLESLTITAGTMASYGFAVARYGPGPQASTNAFMTLTLAQLLHAYSCRSESHGLFGRERLPPNLYLNAAIGGSLALQVLTVLLPGLRGLLGTALPGPADVLAVAAGAALPLVVNEAAKGVRAGGAALAPVLPSGRSVAP